MKILFVTHYYISQVPSTRILHGLSQGLMKEGVEVHIITHAKGIKRELIEVVDGEIIHKVKKDNRLRIVRRLMALAYTYQKNQLAQLLRRMLLLICKKYIYIDYNMVRKVNELVRENGIEVVIPVCQMSFNVISALEAYRKKPRFKLVPYFLDPFSTSTHDYSDIAYKVMLENELFSKCYKAIVTPEMYVEFEKKDSAYMGKMISLGFPMLVPPKLLPAADDIIFDKTKVNCVFVGTLNPDVRNSKYFFEILRRSSEASIVFHLGGGSCERPEVLEMKAIMGERLQLHGIISNQAASNANMNADILVNIGNNMTNMLPSKLFGYFSTGKPLISTYKSQNCPSISQTSKYPICLEINEQLPINDDVVDNFERFCLKHKGETLAYSVVEELYRENTVVYAVGRFLEIIKECER